MPKIIFSQSSPENTLQVYFAQQKGNSFSLFATNKPLISALTLLGFNAEPDTITKLVNPENPQQLLAVAGIGSTLDAASLRNASAVATRNLGDHTSVALHMGDLGEEFSLAIAEGALLGTYKYTAYKSGSTQSKITKITVVSPHKPASKLLKEAEVVASAVSLVKDLVNTPPNDLYPASFVTKARSALKGADVAISVWDEKKLAAEGCGGILGVGQGSSRPPRLMKISYSPAKKRKHIALVGKGITFDTGGLSLKTGAGMIGMKYDMTGAATALSIIRAAAQLKAQVAVTAWLCLAENMPSGTAIRPNDVLTIRGGKTVEVLNTDAEGRLVLADGLTLASEEQPDAIIDIATLTGAATTALGTRYTGAMGTPEIISHLVELGEYTGEKFWHMPLPEELRGYLNSDVADIANVKPGNTAAGMLVGATFLKDFVGKSKKQGESEQIPWVHLDIANTANNSAGPYGTVSAGPTGVAVRSLIKLLQQTGQS